MLSNNKLYVHNIYYGFFILIISCLCQSGCHIYKLPIKQGNELEQKKLDQLRPRQSKQEVQRILGTASLDPITPNRLDYYFSLRPNGDNITKQQHLILIFDKQGNLNHYISDNNDLTIGFLPKARKN